MYLSLFVRDLIDLRRLPEGSSPVNRWFLGWEQSLKNLATLVMQQELKMSSKEGSAQPVIFWAAFMPSCPLISNWHTKWKCSRLTHFQWSSGRRTQSAFFPDVSWGFSGSGVVAGPSWPWLWCYWSMRDPLWCVCSGIWRQEPTDVEWIWTNLFLWKSIIISFVLDIFRMRLLFMQYSASLQTSTDSPPR